MNMFVFGFLIILVFLIVTHRRPSEFKVMRSRTIDASQAELFALVNDFHRWAAWSPWAKLDLTAHNSFEGAASGASSIFKWSGNKKVGAGTMTITESRPSELIHIKVDFTKPFVSTSNVSFTFTPADSQTIVSWSMTSKSNFMAKFISMFVNCDKMVGDMYEEGLANLAKVAEKKN